MDTICLFTISNINKGMLKRRLEIMSYMSALISIDMSLRCWWCFFYRDMSIGHPVNPKYIKKQYRLMRENARQNYERFISGGNGLSSVASGGMMHGGFVPRTHRMCHETPPNLKPREFAALLIEKLEKVQRERESQEKVQQSFKRIQEVRTCSFTTHFLHLHFQVMKNNK